MGPLTRQRLDLLDPPSAASSAPLIRRLEARRLIVGGLVALALLVIGETAPGLFPLTVMVEARDGQVTIETDGSVHAFRSASAISQPWTHVQLIQPDATEREYQVDGSDVTSRKDRDPDEIRAMAATPLYQLAAWLRDETTYSRWEQVRLVDLADGRAVAEGRQAVAATTLPAAFRLEANLRRPEAAVQVDLLTDQPGIHAAVEISRADRSVVWNGPSANGETRRWFFPVQPAPFAAELLQLLGRTVAAGFVLLVAAGLAGWLLKAVPGLRGWLGPGTRILAWLPPAIGLVWLAGAAWVTVFLYHQLPHIVDASAYYFQANVFRSGRLWFDAPPLSGSFKGFFEAVVNGRWFGQYPPGAPALYALGSLVGLEWLIGPLAGVGLIVATALAARYLFGPTAGLAALGLGAVSPFILFQAGSFMSHPIAGAALAGALAAFAYAEHSRRTIWFAAVGALLGWGFLTRELSTILFGLPLIVWLAVVGRWRGLALLLSAGIPFALAYLFYNTQLTGDPFLLPRNVFDSDDRYGFGDIGDTHHTLAAGLEYLDQNLTLLQFDLFGWPPLFALSLLGLPFLLGQTRRYDLLLGAALLLYIAGYIGVPGHGIVLGPRYYYEALPWLLLLATRGLQSIVATLRTAGLPTVLARGGVLVVVGLLTLNTVLFYDPHLVERRTDYFAMDYNRGVRLPFVNNTLFGPRLTGFDRPTLVLVPDVVAYKTLSALNCPLLDKQHVDDCQVLFVQTGLDHAADLIQAYPGRSVLTATVSNGAVQLAPFQLPG